MAQTCKDASLPLLRKARVGSRKEGLIFIVSCLRLLWGWKRSCGLNRLWPVRVGVQQTTHPLSYLYSIKRVPFSVQRELELLETTALSAQCFLVRAALFVVVGMRIHKQSTQRSDMTQPLKCSCTLIASPGAMATLLYLQLSLNNHTAAAAACCHWGQMENEQ